MLYMVVTLDVSKLSGWLNADACCRVGRRAYVMRGERYKKVPCAQRRGKQRVRGGARLHIGAGKRGGTHVKHAAHGCEER